MTSDPHASIFPPLSREASHRKTVCRFDLYTSCGAHLTLEFCEKGAHIILSSLCKSAVDKVDKEHEETSNGTYLSSQVRRLSIFEILYSPLLWGCSCWRVAVWPPPHQT